MQHLSGILFGIAILDHVHTEWTRLRERKNPVWQVYLHTGVWLLLAQTAWEMLG